MKWRLAGLGVAAIVAQACGGVAQDSRGEGAAAPDESDARAGRDGGSHVDEAGVGGSGVGAVAGLSGGTRDLEVPIAGASGAPPGIPEGEACFFPPPSCNVRGQSIDLIEDGVHLSYPLDASCGQCSYKCEVCDELTCSLWAHGTVNCGDFRLSAAACAGPDSKPPCLNSVSSQPYYVDASGKRWDLVLFTGSESELPSPAPDGPVDLEAQLTISDGLQTRRLTARAHVCGSFSYTLVICK